MAESKQPTKLAPILLPQRMFSKRMVELLLKKNPKIDARDHSGSTPLHLASCNGHRDVVEQLLLRGAKVNATNLTKKTPLHLAAGNGHADVVQLLLRRPGIKIGWPDSEGRTPLHWAASRHFPVIVEMMLRNGANPNRKDKFRKSPLHMATYFPRHNTAQLLPPIHPPTLQPQRSTSELEVDEVDEEPQNEAPPPSPARKSQRTPLHNAVTGGNLAAAQKLLQDDLIMLDEPDEDGATPLQLAVKHKQPELVELLLEKKASLVARDWRGVLDLFPNADRRNKAEFLMAQNVKTDSICEGGRTPLHLATLSSHPATMTGHPAAAEELLRRGAPINAPDAAGRTALHLAARNRDSNMVHVLMYYNANPYVTDNRGKTPLQLVLRKDPARREEFRAIVWLLLRCGSIVEAVDWRRVVAHFSHTAKIDIERFLAHRVDVTSKDKDGRTPLHLAMESGLVVVKTLLMRKADVNARDYNLKTPLHLAIENDRREIVELLLDNGAEIDAADRDGKTPLHAAVDGMDTSGRRHVWIRSPLAVRRLLIEYGAVFDPSNGTRRTRP